MHLSSKEVIDYTTGFSNGTKMPRTNWGDLGSYKLVAPPQELILRYNTIVSEMFSTIKNSIFEMKSLSQIRDSLLPRLISGEIELSDNDISKIMEPAK
jgi:type I restriction enzyme S subunit